jgi:hypothetical protein
MTFDPQEAPENFLALISPDCQQQSLDVWLTAVPRTRKVPGRPKNIASAGQETLRKKFCCISV